MLHNKLLTDRHTRRPRGGRAPESKVITILSNLRWNLGGFEISRWAGGVVWMIFLIDTCNREIIDRATTTGRCL
jgi:putative transposase